MATIVFCVHPIMGSVNASLKIAKDLTGQGHRVLYMGLAQCGKMVAPHGFEFIPMFKRWFPEDEKDENFNKKKPLGYWGSLMDIRKYIRYLKSFIRDLMEGGTRSFMRSLAR